MGERQARGAARPCRRSKRSAVRLHSVGRRGPAIRPSGVPPAGPGWAGGTNLNGPRPGRETRTAAVFDPWPAGGG